MGSEEAGHMIKDTQWQDLNLNLGFGLQGWFSSPCSIVALDFKIPGQSRTPVRNRGWDWRWLLLTCPPLFLPLVPRLCWKHISSLEVANEPVLAFTQGSPERDALQKALKELKGRTEAIPCVVGDEEVWTSDVRYQVSPFNHGHKVAKFCYADKALLHRAIEAALAARKEWDLKPVADRAQVFLKAADMLSGPRRAEILAKTMVGQGKTVIQAEIDAAAELIDFFRFNAKFAVELEGQQPISVPPSTNSVVYRGLEGFVAAISPFNFTAIGGNLAGAPALMGNVVLWKPSDTAMLASYAVYRVLREAGLPPNIIQFVPADGPTFGDTVTSSEHLCGINFTGSVPTFKHLWKQVAQNLDHFRTFPRLAGECGGKNFHFVHRSADVDSVVSGTLRSAFEYGGQKCSACSRLYVPGSLWPQIKGRLLEEHGRIKVGDSFGRIRKWLEHARSSPSLTILAGGQCDDSVGYFVEPCIIESKDPQEPIMKEEIFGPLLTVYVYPDDKYKETLRLVDSTTSYGLTGQCLPRISESPQPLCSIPGVLSPTGPCCPRRLLPWTWILVIMLPLLSIHCPDSWAGLPNTDRPRQQALC
uniref:Multifunctional fusion protein n=1 Tax=Sus scrofa TaxID=9823 RepID=A0A4X1W7U5_PIG